MKVKLCGFSEEKSLKVALDNGADFIGFVFYEKSPRNINLEQAKKLGEFVGEKALKVSVTVDADLEFLEKIEKSLKPHYFQLHGNENRQKIIEIKKKFPKIKIIKAIKVEKKSDLDQNIDFVDLVDFLLFDNIMAGSGKSWDYSLLKNFKCEKDWFLSGGLNSDNILSALENSGSKMIDVSSGIEKERGKKSPELIMEFMKKVKTSELF